MLVSKTLTLLFYFAQYTMFVTLSMKFMKVKHLHTILLSQEKDYLQMRDEKEEV